MESTETAQGLALRNLPQTTPVSPTSSTSSKPVSITPSARVRGWLASASRKLKVNGGMAMFKRYLVFAGGSAFICTSYIDPGNYATDVQAGAQFRFYLLFVIFLSNCIAIFLQTLAIKLGTVTGRDLAQISKQELPRWLNLILYILAEAAIIATDIAEVVGTAVALNILLRIPLIAGVVLTIVDVLLVLLAYRSEQSIGMIRYFEYGVAMLVVAVAVCFAVQLTNMPPTPAADIFRGFLPSSHLLKDGAMYASCGILGATVMPHSLYLGSSIVKPRVIHRDVMLGNVPEKYSAREFDDYKPSVAAIEYSLKYSIIELAISLCTFAFFINSAILIVAGATLYGTESANSADLFSIHQSLHDLISRGAATLFMVALLLSGQSAGIVCTVAGQIVSEGYLNWNIKRTWIRRLITRGIAIVPCLVVTAAVGRSGLSQVLNASQAALSILLPFLVLPLIYFTSRPSIMCVEVSGKGDGAQSTATAVHPVPTAGTTSVAALATAPPPEPELPLYDTKAETNISAAEGPSSDTDSPEPCPDKEDITEQAASRPSSSKEDVTTQTIEQSVPRIANYTNSWLTMVFGTLIWLFICVLNVYLIVQLAMGKT